MKKIDFDNDSIKKNILQAALPMLVAQILSLLYNIVDRIYIARIPDVGTTALGAVGLCFPIIMLTIAFSNLFGSGGAPLFSIKRGMSDDKAANTIMNTSFTMVCTFAVIFTALCMIFAKPLLILFGAQKYNLLSRQNVRLLGGGKPFKSSHNALGKRQFPRRELRGKIFRDLFAEGAVFFLQDIFVSFGHRSLFPHGTC